MFYVLSDICLCIRVTNFSYWSIFLALVTFIRNISQLFLRHAYPRPHPPRHPPTANFDPVPDRSIESKIRFFYFPPAEPRFCFDHRATSSEMCFRVLHPRFFVFCLSITSWPSPHSHSTICSLLTPLPLSLHPAPPHHHAQTTRRCGRQIINHSKLQTNVVDLDLSARRDAPAQDSRVVGVAVPVPRRVAVYLLRIKLLVPNRTT